MPLRLLQLVLVNHWPLSAVRVVLLTLWVQAVPQQGQEILPYRDKEKTSEGGRCFTGAALESRADGGEWQGV